MKRGQEKQVIPSPALPGSSVQRGTDTEATEAAEFLGAQTPFPCFPVHPEAALHDVSSPGTGCVNGKRAFTRAALYYGILTNVLHSGLCFSANLWRRGMGIGANFRFWPRSIWCRARMTWLTVESSVGSIDIILHLTGYCSLNFEQESRSSKNTSGPKRKQPKQSLNKARKQETYSPSVTFAFSRTC